MNGDSREPDVSDREILAVLANADDQWLRATEVAADLPIGSELLSDRLDDLYERGQVDRAVEGRPDEEWRLAPGTADPTGATVETELEAQASTATGPGTQPHEIETPESPPPEPGSEVPGEPYHLPTDDVEAFDPPGTPEQKARRREALRQAYAYLRERGRASREEFESDVFPDAQGAYEHPDDGWWEDVVRPGLARFPDTGPVEGGDGWRYAGETRDASED